MVSPRNDNNHDSNSEIVVVAGGAEEDCVGRQTYRWYIAVLIQRTHKVQTQKSLLKACPNYNSQKNSEDSLNFARGIATIDCRFTGIGPDLFGDGLGGEIGAVLLGLEQE
jgi:hypothetical protein